MIFRLRGVQTFLNRAEQSTGKDDERDRLIKTLLSKVKDLEGDNRSLKESNMQSLVYFPPLTPDRTRAVSTTPPTHTPSTRSSGNGASYARRTSSASSSTPT